jgi:hypothetical protein
MIFSRCSALLVLVALAGCERTGAPPSPSVAPVASSPADAARERAQAEERACRERLGQIIERPRLPGAPGFEGKRVELLGRGKGEPVVFLRTPRFEQDLPLRLSLIRDEMRRKSPWLGIPRAFEQLRYFPQDLRRLFLAEGYVYSESPAEAAVLIDVLTFGRLFREPELWVARGGETFRVVRDKQGAYRHADGL